jgi:predicted RNA-binding Zn-ribbon protein involved in translation (DUF1610 family)
MGDSEKLDMIPDHLAEKLDPSRNYQWSGVGRRRDLGHAPSRVLSGEYVGWFQWYMRHQRFKAFHTVILIDPLAAVSDGDTGGFIDGFIARLIKASQVVVVTRGVSEQTKPEADQVHVKTTLMSLLYGTRMCRAELTEATKLTLRPISDSALQKALDDSQWRRRLRHSRYELDEDDEELVQGMVPKWRPSGPDEPPEEIEQLFGRPKRKEYVRPDTGWVETEVLKLARMKGWFTSQMLAEYFQQLYGELARSADPPPKEVYPYVQREYRTEAQVFRPSPWIVRRVCEKLVTEGRLVTHQWYRELGRPALVFTESGGTLPFKEDDSCGQCAFYMGSKNQCQVWSLIRWKYRSWGFRWAGPRPEIDPFQKYKMDNSHRIGPHSSACKLFLDKKRDHLRKKVPAACEVCAETLKLAKGIVVVCPNCGTVYSPWSGKVRVQTGYEHEFRRRYEEITGSDAEEDKRVQREEWSKSRERDWERMMPLAPTPDLLRAEKPKPERLPWPKPTFSETLQRFVDKRTRTTDIAKRLSLAMVHSTINATKRLAVIGRPDSSLLEESTRRQERCLSLISESKVGRLLVYEAQAMKEYWACYDSALKPAQQWFGPRVRYRFVSEYVDETGGRAKGYSALHAAINYLHQRRFLQALRINAEVGFKGTSDGFLHRKSYNSEQRGLLFDMIDPFKFGDREKLLAVVLNRGITWRDFMMESDRYNSTFYYPASNTILVLEQVGADADQIIVQLQGIESSLTNAYRQFATSLLAALESTKGEFEPFVYTPV